MAVVAQRGVELHVVGLRVVACGVAPPVRAAARADKALQRELVAVLEALALIPGKKVVAKGLGGQDEGQQQV